MRNSLLGMGVCGGEESGFAHYGILSTWEGLAQSRAK